MARGLFISFEGGEGAGKSTQLARLATTLAARGRTVVATREPGGTRGAEAIRTLLRGSATDRWSPMAEALLLYAARADHLERVIEPALSDGAIVLCDRFADSTRAYQVAAGGASPDLVEALERFVLHGRWPDLTLVFDLDPAVGLARARARGGEHWFEGREILFHERLRAAFREIAGREPGRCRVIDAAGEVGEVSQRVLAVVAQADERR